LVQGQPGKKLKTLPEKLTRRGLGYGSNDRVLKHEALSSIPDIAKNKNKQNKIKLLLPCNNC
jgi:hypothetical protein